MVYIEFRTNSFSQKTEIEPWRQPIVEAALVSASGFVAFLFVSFGFTVWPQNKYF